MAESIAITSWEAMAQPICAPALDLVLTDAPNAAIPHVVSMRMASPKIRYLPFEFPEGPVATLSQPTRTSPTVKRRPAKSVAPRIKPPDDVVKLHDRLYYVLQPALDTLLGTDALTLPFEPFPYQYTGVSFLFPRQSAVLADEMGLGKTMQAITAIRLLLHTREITSIILICPKPLISNWQRELALWAPEIPVAVVRGSMEQRRWAWQRPEFPVKIANYEAVLRDAKLVEQGDISADLVVLDEAQRVKNSSGSTSRVIRAIPRGRSWALTGTPIENSTDDLVGIFEFLTSGLLSKGMSPRRMSHLTRDYILRRTKDEVLTDLPPKLFRDAMLDLSPEQQESYRMAEDEGIVHLHEIGAEMTIQHVFELVLRLKQICNFDPATGVSTKLERLRADLDEVAASGKKAIVFSQWVRTLNRLADELKSFKPLQYHGQISAQAREQAVEDFRQSSEHSVMLLSYGAGAVGLNLQFTSYVFLFDRWWNPAVEDQAINRAHRIGSAEPVTITRFVTPGTIEQRIDDVLREKRELMSTILDQTDTPRQMGLSQQEIFGLFDLK